MISFWHESAEDISISRDELSANIDVDIAIVGAGYSGLWSAYYLKLLRPNARIAIIEANQVGFGASGRNGGWCSGFLPVTLNELGHEHGRQAAINMYRESFKTID